MNPWVLLKHLVPVVGEEAAHRLVGLMLYHKQTCGAAVLTESWIITRLCEEIGRLNGVMDIKLEPEPEENSNGA